MRYVFSILMVLLLISLTVTTVGCAGGTPPEVVAAAEAEGDLIQSYGDFVASVLDTAYQDLDRALETQMDLILDYELQIRASGDQVALAQVQDLLSKYRSKREQIRTEMDTVKLQLRQSEVTLGQVMRLHEKLTSYLAREQVSAADFRALLTEIKSAWRAEGGN